ncbi:unnamed protein product, partial [Owenia fusiformis]
GSIRRKFTSEKNMDQYFFEGTEKLLEVWFSTSDPNKDADLRNIKREKWVDLLSLVGCEIVSETKDRNMDSYVLSESSMFISKDRFILKTCGRTTLLHAIKPLKNMVLDECGFDIVGDLFYSRKKFMRPELQNKPHQCFNDEVSLLDDMFDNGAAYCLGRLNQDCWYLYTFDNVGVIQPDQTLELLMSDLDPAVMKVFTKGKEGSLTAKEATQKSGIADLLPDVVIDDFLFDPCGYSMNGLLPDSKYITIHITPEKQFSYVSFETNVPKASYKELVNKILSCFRPGKCLMTIFANEASMARDTHLDFEDKLLAGYKKQDQQLCKFKNYNLSYTHYTICPPAPPH